MRFFAAIWIFCSIAMPAVAQHTLQGKLEQYIYITTQVSKKSCYVGEPIIVTYTLHTALESTSAIIKSPSFSGFMIENLVSVKDNRVSREVKQQLPYDVHIIKKVQLTPEHAGIYTIDPLVLLNKIQLDGEPWLQKIAAGYKQNNDGLYEHTIATSPTTIHVQALPLLPEGTQYSGATGSYTMMVHLQNNEMVVGEEGVLQVTITGQGDLANVSLPAIKWPEAAVVGTPKVTMKVSDGRHSDTSIIGYKIFEVPFNINHEGTYFISGIEFSYFDVEQKKYITIRNKELSLNVVKAAYVEPTSEYSKKGMQNFKSNLLQILSFISVLLLIYFFIKLLFGKKKAKTGIVAEEYNSVEQLLKHAADNIYTLDRSFYDNLQKGVYGFLQQRFHVADTVNKPDITNVLALKNVPEQTQQFCIELLTDIETNLYAGTQTQSEKQQLLNNATTLLHALDEYVK